MNKEISLYIHIPFCLSKCDYCDFFSIVRPCKKQESPIPDEYITSLVNEIKYRMAALDSPVIKTIYIGGGTPSLLNEAQLARLTDVIFSYKVLPDYEFTVEVNPDDVTKELLQALQKNKVNRISCGVQSFSDTVLKSIHRRAKNEQILQSLGLFSQFWSGITSVDLICGLPGETEQSFMQGLKKLADSKIPHISVYSLCVEEGTVLGDSILNGSTEYDYDAADKLWIKGRDYLLEHGYVQYEVSNFCLAGYECRHNMTYWKHEPYLGCGSGATGTLYNSDGSGLRITNEADVERYINYWNSRKEGAGIPQLEEKIDIKTSMFEFFMMGLRTKNGVNLEHFEAVFGCPVPQKVVLELDNWVSLGSCVRQNSTYFLNEKGLLFLNSLLEKLDFD